MQPVNEKERVETLDVLRGFAVLGILILNIVGFGMVSAAYSNPGFDLIGGSRIDLIAWAGVDVFFEGAMRTLFSMLFGAGVVLFTDRRRGSSFGTHYRRTLLLLLFGLINGYVLLWNGDILVNYAICGALLYWLRNVRAGWMFVWAVLLFLLLSAWQAGVGMGLGQLHKAAVQVEQSEDPSTVSPEMNEAADQWYDFERDFVPTENMVAMELSARRGNYVSAFHWNAEQETGMIFFVLPMFLLWDALVMMLIGMALYRSGVMQGAKSRGFYVVLAVGGFAVGLLMNSYEVNRAIGSNFELLKIFAQAQPTYHIGRLGMALGYLSLICLIVKSSGWRRFRNWMAATGRMALTNYLGQSVICMFLFTGAGFALVGEINRAGLYLLVVPIWIVQVAFSVYWMKRYHYGPAEWVWRGLTYGTRPRLKR